MPDIGRDLLRSSFKSIMTSTSSIVDSYASTVRSSVDTKYSSTSDLPRLPSNNSRLGRDESFNVEDAIGLYDDLGTPGKDQSFDFGFDADSPTRPSTSPAPRSTSQSSLGFRRRFPQPEERPPLPSRTSSRPSHDNNNDSNGNNDKPSFPVRTDSITPPPRDRYGFKKISHYVTLEQYDAWESEYNMHLEHRKMKWETLMKQQYGLSTDNPSRFPPRSDRTKRYVRKGIPPEWRGAAWFWYAGGPGRQKKYEGVYYDLLRKIKYSNALKAIDREHIERDLNRTFPDNITFKPDTETQSANGGLLSDGMGYNEETKEEPIIESLRRVLQAFAVYRPGIGYCQSLNFIAGLLLLFLKCDEEKSFLLLDVITSEYLPGTHGVSLEGANVDIAVLMTNLKEILPAVWTKVDDKPHGSRPNSTANNTFENRTNQVASMVTTLNLPTVSLATTPWFLTLYLTTTPIETTLRIWDVLFYEGSKTLFRAALAIFKLCEPKIKEVNDSMEVFQIVQTTPRGMLDANTVMELCFCKRGGGFGALSQESVDRKRDELRQLSKQPSIAVTEVMNEARTESVSSAIPSDRVVVNNNISNGVAALVKSRFRSRTRGAQG